MLIDAWLIADAWLAVVAGLTMLVWPLRHRRSADERRARRLAELEAGAAERYFEERRSLTSSQPPGAPGVWRLAGVLALAAGVFDLWRTFAPPP